MNEYKRAFINRYWLFSLLVLTLIIGWLYIDRLSPDGTIQGTQEQATVYLNVLYQTEEMDPEDALVFLDNEIEELNDYIVISVWHQSKENNPQYYESLREHYLELNADIVAMAEAGAMPMSIQTAELHKEHSQRLIDQYEHLLSYPDELIHIQENAERLTRFSIFNQEHSYSNRNIMKTASDFEQIDRTKIALGPDYAITSLFESSVSDYAVFGSILLLVYLLLQDRKSGLWSLVHVSPRGRSVLAYKRLFILFLGSIQSVLLIQGIQTVLSLVLFGGWGEMSRHIQSIEAFKHVTLPLSITQFMLLYLCLKIYTTFLIAVLCYFVISTISNLNLGIAYAAVIFVVQFISYTTIRDSARLIPLKYINIFAYINTIPILAKYLNMNILGYPISGRFLTLMTIPLFMILFSVLMILSHVRKYPISSPNIVLTLFDRIKAIFDKYTVTRGAFRYELFKLFVVQKGIIILLLFLVYEFTYTGIPSIYLSNQEFTVISYRNEFEAVISSDLIMQLETEVDQLQSELDDLLAEQGNEFTMQVESLSNQLAAMITLRTDAERLLDYSDLTGQQTYLFDDTIYRAYTNSDDTGYQYKTALRLTLVTVLLLSTLFTIEKDSKMTNLNRATLNGRNRLWRHKIYVAMLTVLLISVVTYGSELFRSTQVHGSLRYLNAPIQQFRGFETLGLTLSIGQFMLMIFLVRIFVLMALASLTMLVSENAPTREAALVLSSIVFLVPAFLMYSGISHSVWASFIAPLSAVDHLMNYPLHYAIILVLGVVSMFIGRFHFIIYKKN